MFNGKFGVDPPWYQESQIEREAFNLYAMECEGLLSTRQGEISTDQEVEYIESEVAKYGIYGY
jgi:hypothetical protein